MLVGPWFAGISFPPVVDGANHVHKSHLIGGDQKVVQHMFSALSWVPPSIGIATRLRKPRIRNGEEFLATPVC